jgi:NADH dehydrogenase
VGCRCQGAPEVLKDLAGLESNRINHLLVCPTLQTTHDENIFAFGGCAACPWAGKGGTVPPEHRRRISRLRT